MFYVAADNLPPGALFEQVGTAFFPKLLAGLLGILALLLVASARVAPEAAAEPEVVDRRGFYGTVAVALSTVPLWWAIGFLATPLLIAGIMVATGSRRPRQVAVVSLAASVVLYLVFFRLFPVPVPLGLLER